MNSPVISRRVALAAGMAAVSLTTARAGVAKALAYRGIRYARAKRFAEATLEPFSESLVKTERGPIPPQLPSRLEISMGPQAPLRQDEDCQVLSVFTPARTGKRPVLVFIHGGAFVSGGGELPWYDGDRLAAEQDIVVVTVTYRLGALGYWLAPGSTGLSPGLSDQITALKWVQANISKFGGDPANVTLSGQSAGCASVRSIIDRGYGQKLFKRAIAQSGRPVLETRADREAVARQFEGLLGADPRTAPVEALLETQAKLTRANAGNPSWRPFAPDTITPVNVDVVVGWNREDPAAHMLLAEGKKPTPGAPLERFREATKASFLDAQAYARAVASGGHKAYAYSFDWNAPDTGMGDPHCIELTFLFGNRAAWEKAPMLGGANWVDYERMGKTMRSWWGAFVRTGNPGATWKSATATDAPVNSLV